MAALSGIIEWFKGANSLETLAVVIVVSFLGVTMGQVLLAFRAIKHATRPQPQIRNFKKSVGIGFALSLGSLIVLGLIGNSDWLPSANVAAQGQYRLSEIECQNIGQELSKIETKFEIFVFPVASNEAANLLADEISGCLDAHKWPRRLSRSNYLPSSNEGIRVLVSIETDFNKQLNALLLEKILKTTTHFGVGTAQDTFLAPGSIGLQIGRPPASPGQVGPSLEVLILIVVLVAGVVIAMFMRHGAATPSTNDAVELSATPPPTTAIPVENGPEPIFMCPRQGASQHYLSWPHVPVTLNKLDGEIRNCTVELDMGNGLPARMRWQADDPHGVEEISLIGGRTRMVPISIRCEAGYASEIHPLPISDGIARLTGRAYLLDGQVDKFSLKPGRHIFHLRIRSGAKQWVSPHRYLLNVPPKDDSNGQFFLEIWHEGKD